MGMNGAIVIGGLYLQYMLNHLMGLQMYDGFLDVRTKC